MQSITTTYYTPEQKAGKPTGSWLFDRQQSASEVLNQIKTVLASIPYPHDEANALQICEYISRELEDETQFPEGEVFTTMRYGTSEGYFVYIYNHAPDNTIQLVAYIKFLCEKDFVYDVAKQLNEAFRNGLFESVQAPDSTQEKQ